MNNLADTISGSVKQMGQAFLLAYYLPASIAVLIHLYILIPIWTNAPPLFLSTNTDISLPLIGDPDLASLIGTLLLPLVVGIVLVGLNSVLIRIFEGKPWWLKFGFLYPLTRFNGKRCKRLHGNLVDLQKEYLRVSSLSLQPQSSAEKKQIDQQLAGLAQQINEEHGEIEKAGLRQSLPHNPHRVCPTAFGNAYAIAEEYAYERYGVDSVLFWPRLRELMHESAVEHSERITQQTTALDLSLNLAFLCGLMALEAMLTLRFGPMGHDSLLLLLTVVNLVLFAAFYHASVSAVSLLGELIKSSFDFFRTLLLEAFDLEAPNDLTSERAVWARLAVFILRGNEFYFPMEARRADGQDAEAKTKGPAS